MGFLLLILIILGCRGGFTGITYPLTVMALALCAAGSISTLYAIALIPLAHAHYSRMRHPIFTPPALARSGLVPILGLLGALLSILVLSRVAYKIVETILSALVGG